MTDTIPAKEYRQMLLDGEQPTHHYVTPEQLEELNPTTSYGNNPSKLLKDIRKIHPADVARLKEEAEERRKTRLQMAVLLQGRKAFMEEVKAGADPQESTPDLAKVNMTFLKNQKLLDELALMTPEQRIRLADILDVPTNVTPTPPPPEPEPSKKERYNVRKVKAEAELRAQEEARYGYG